MIGMSKTEEYHQILKLIGRIRACGDDVFKKTYNAWYCNQCSMFVAFTLLAPTDYDDDNAWGWLGEYSEKHYEYHHPFEYDVYKRSIECKD